jgi:pyruvate/2-oxoglutarate dehydrogenase complex dihydrolipoamide acyltransferase (E2) component
MQANEHHTCGPLSELQAAVDRVVPSQCPASVYWRAYFGRVVEIAQQHGLGDSGSLDQAAPPVAAGSTAATAAASASTSPSKQPAAKSAAVRTSSASGAGGVATSAAAVNNSSSTNTGASTAIGKAAVDAAASPTGSSEADGELQLLLLTLPECFVYKIPARPSAMGHRHVLHVERN